MMIFHFENSVAARKREVRHLFCIFSPLAVKTVVASVSLTTFEMNNYSVAPFLVLK